MNDTLSQILIYLPFGAIFIIIFACICRLHFDRKQMNELKLNLKILKESQTEQEKKLQTAQTELEKSKTELQKSLKEMIQLESKSNQLQTLLKKHEETIEQQKKQSQELKKSYQKQRKSRNFWRGLSLISVIAFLLK